MGRLEFYFQYLTSDPLGFLVFFLYFSLALLFTLVVHEYAHAYVAYLCGDNTAKMLGRLTMNPAKHLDPMGTLFMMIFGFGWAKPVPINPRNFEKPVRDDIFVSIAGIVTNLTLYLLSTLLMIGLNRFVWKPEVIEYFGHFELIKTGGIGYMQIISGNLDALSSFVVSPFAGHVQRFLMFFAQFNLMVAIFNFLPFPPLDGFHIFNNLLFKGRLASNRNAMQIASMVLMLMVFTNTLSGFLSTVSNAIETGVLNTMLKLIGV